MSTSTNTSETSTSIYSLTSIADSIVETYEHEAPGQAPSIAATPPSTPTSLNPSSRFPPRSTFHHIPVNSNPMFLYTHPPRFTRKEWMAIWADNEPIHLECPIARIIEESQFSGAIFRLQTTSLRVGNVPTLRIGKRLVLNGHDASNVSYFITRLRICKGDINYIQAVAYNANCVPLDDSAEWPSFIFQVRGECNTMKPNRETARWMKKNAHIVEEKHVTCFSALVSLPHLLYVVFQYIRSPPKFPPTNAALEQV